MNRTVHGIAVSLILSYVHLWPGTFIVSPSLWSIICSLVTRTVHSIAVCLVYHLFTCVLGCSWHHHLSELSCAHLYSGGTFMASSSVWSMLCSPVSRVVPGITICELCFGHLCPGRFMTSPSLWAILCSLVFRGIHCIIVCGAMLCSLAFREVHGITFFLGYSVLTCVQECSWYSHLSGLYAVLTCVNGCSWHYHLSEPCCAHLCPGTSWHHHLSDMCCAYLCPCRNFMDSPSVWAMLCYAHLCQGMFMLLPSV